jgi:hypothetical protein
MVNEEYTLATEISEVEAIKPPSLAKAMRCPNWPSWEHRIFEELETL